MVTLELVIKYEKESICYWHDYQNHEVDFIIKKRNSSAAYSGYIRIVNGRGKGKEIGNPIKTSKKLKMWLTSGSNT